jgi:hypothetical protein
MLKTAHRQHIISSSFNCYRNATKSKDEGGGMNKKQKPEEKKICEGGPLPLHSGF